MSESFKNSRHRLIQSYRLSVKYLLLMSIPVAVGTVIIADKLILLIYDASFVNSATVLRILIWTLVFTSVNSVLLTLLISIDRQKLNLFSTGLCAIVNVLLNFILIPIISYTGASIATLLTSVVLFIISFYHLSRHLHTIPIHKIIIKPVISSLLMGVFVYYFIHLNIFLLVFMAILIYISTLMILKTFSKEDVRIFKQILGIKLF